MASTTTRYVPRDYRRLCDCCGMPFNISKLTRHENGLFYCSEACAGERDKDMLTRGNAAQRPFRVRPVPHPKPLDNNYPNTLEADEGALLDFLEQQLSGTPVRYELIASGDGAPLSADHIATASWAARYLHGLANDTNRPTIMRSKAETLFRSAVDFLLTRQQGSPTGLSTASTRANDAFFGGFLDEGTFAGANSSDTWVTEDAITAGYALLLAYRHFEQQKYLTGARSAASYLRNVQAIGSNGTHFTSSNAAGTTRLYTGALASYVANVSGFYSDHAFYPASMLALEFWSELQETDGDQSIGATAVVTGFDTVPAQLLSQSIADLRAFWLTGVEDANGDTFSGFSSIAPRDFFNAYPATKPNTPITGTGMWEFSDGDADTGTTVSGTNFAKGLAGLHAYEGLSDQVETVDLWLRSFTSNDDFETPENTSPSVLARSETGDYDATQTVATELLVRNPDDGYATVARNGSALYDWGALGLLSDFWATAHSSTFRSARLKPLNIHRRFSDGIPQDGLYWDRIQLRGKSGLSLQTAFTELTGTPANVDLGCNDAITPSSPTSSGLCLWLKSDAGVTTQFVIDSYVVTRWEDQSGYGQHMTVAPLPPTYVESGLGGKPAVLFSTTTYIERNAALKTTAGINFDGSVPRTIFVIGRPGTAVGGRTGGVMLAFRKSEATGAYVMYCLRLASLGPLTNPVVNHDWWPEWASPIYSAIGGTRDNQPDYANTPILAIDTYDAVSMSRWINGVPILQSSDGITYANAIAVGVGDGAGSTPVFTVGNVGGFGSYTYGFIGELYEILVYDRVLTAEELETTGCYLAGRYNGSNMQTVMVNDAVRAAQFGLSYRANR